MDSELIANWPMWASLFVIACTIVVYVLDRWSMELVSIGVILALLLALLLTGLAHWLHFDGERTTALR